MQYYTTNQISENISETPEGFLLCRDVAIARTGIQEYANGETPLSSSDGVVMMLREEEEVFHPDAIASFEGKPLTISHPDSFVTPDNWKDLTVGIVQNVHRGTGVLSDKLISDLLVTDARAIALVKGGLREVSGGYEADYEEAGSGKGKQLNIRGNHVALVSKGRAGSTCAIHDNHKEVSMYKKITDKIKATLSKTIDEAMAAVEGEEVQKDADPMMEIRDMCKSLDDRLAKLEGVTTDMPEVEIEKEDNGLTGDSIEDAPVDSIDTLIGKIDTSIAELRALVGATKEVVVEATVTPIVESVLDADTISRAEILAPGIVQDNDIKRNALKAAYATTDGRSVIDTLNAGHAANFDGDNDLSPLFIAASELLKTKRSNGLANSKAFDSSITPFHKAGHITADKLNEINAKFWADKAAK
jgi:hypothetical protein